MKLLTAEERIRRLKEKKEEEKKKKKRIQKRNSMRKWRAKKKKEKEKEKRIKEKEKEKAKIKEKEDKKKLKEKAKRLEKRHCKYNKYLRNYMRKVREKRYNERIKSGDVYGYFMVVLTKNRKRIKTVARSWWRNNALDKYESLLNENNSSVLCPLEISKNVYGVMIDGKEVHNTEYELLLIQKKDKGDDTSNMLRNSDGKLVENIILDSDYQILKKDEWLIEETFYVYGYHPKKDRKTAHFILDMLVNNCNRDNIKRVFIFKNKLVFQYNDDFDFIVCKNKDEAFRLYDILEKSIKKLNMNKYIFFTDELKRGLTSWFLDAMEEKTGWPRNVCNSRCS